MQLYLQKSKQEKLIQVVAINNKDTEDSSHTVTCRLVLFAECSDVAVSLTPSNASNKILIFEAVDINICCWTQNFMGIFKAGSIISGAT